MPTTPYSKYGNSAKFRLSQAPRSGDGPAFRSLRQRKSSMTLMVGGFMFCLVLAYVAIVIVVTRQHLTSNSMAGNMNINNKIDHQSPLSVMQAHEQNVKSNEGSKHQQPQQQQQQQQHVESQAEKDARNPFFQHKDLKTNELKPHAIHPAAKDTTDKSVYMPIKEDPPKNSHPSPEHVLTAYLEPPNLEEWEEKPLPVRSKAQASLLQKREYTRVNSCNKLLLQFPVDDTPAEDDPFLPWIHDVFPTADGKYIQFVAQNRRRCRTGVKKLNQTDIMMQQQPQVALFQHVPVKRVADKKYRLSTYEEADPDGLTTRFICRFKPSMEETLSVHNFDYDWISYRKRYKVTFDKYDGGIKSIHTSQLIFKCPVPPALQETIRQGTSVIDDWATLFLDIVPIRTPPRYGLPMRFFQPKYQEFQEKNKSIAFNAKEEWGSEHILPDIADSGRWENIPICKPSLMQYENQPVEDVPPQPQERQEKHHLVSCIWASSGYSTRGDRFAINDGQRRLLEWISYNKVIGFDHFYIYDNSGAMGLDTSLKPITDLFPGEVTYIPWPSQICNNRPNNVDSPGERSSQYAAESSCRLRFGPHVKWIGQFDIDEYLIPMGKHATVTQLLSQLDKEDTRIISFGSWRAWPRRAFIDEIKEINDFETCWHNEPCFHLTIPTNTTMLQAYNCDRQPPGKKDKVMPAEKQVYRADYVTHHFVHYSAVTKLSEMNKTEYIKQGFPWRRRAFPDPRQRFGNEETEALMLHSKAVAVQDTAGYKRMCDVKNLDKPIRQQGQCRLGVPWPKPWPEDPTKAKRKGTREGYAYNCYVNQQIEEVLVPRLETELNKHKFFRR